MERLTQTQLLEPVLTPAISWPKLSEVLGGSRERGFNSLAVLSSNVRAVESALRFSQGINHFVALVGSSGWGKSHLLESAARNFSQHGFAECPVYSAHDWLADQRIRSHNGPLILDNVQDLSQKTRSRIEFQIAMERRVKAGRPTLLAFTEPKMSRTSRSCLPNFREWVVATIKPPTELERRQIVAKITSNEDMTLSENLVRILATHISGNGRSLLGALKRLRLTQSDWTTSPAVLKACGILGPYLEADSGWDLREHITDKAKMLPADCRQLATPFDLSIYTMLRVALIAESDVAKFFRIEPAKCYSYGAKFEHKVLSHPQLAKIASHFIDSVVESL